MCSAVKRPEYVILQYFKHRKYQPSPLDRDGKPRRLATNGISPCEERGGEVGGGDKVRLSVQHLSVPGNNVICKL